MYVSRLELPQMTIHTQVKCVSKAGIRLDQKYNQFPYFEPYSEFCKTFANF